MQNAAKNGRCFRKQYLRSLTRGAAVPYSARFFGFDRLDERVAPAKTPRSIVDKLYADLRVILREPDVREEFIQRQGLIPVDSAAPDELRTFVEAEIVRLGDIVRKAGLAASE